VKVDGNVYAFDSTTIDLCLNVFWWAEFRKAKGDIKMHTLYDVKTRIPSFVYITPASVNDVNAMDNIPYERGSGVAIVGKELKIDRSTYEILQILGISLLDKTHVKELLANNNYKNVK